MIEPDKPDSCRSGALLRTSSTTVCSAYPKPLGVLICLSRTAWPVNFNMSLQSFEPSIKSVRSLVDIALSSRLASPPSVLFSSVSVLRSTLQHFP